MSKYFHRIFTIIDLHFGAMQPCSSGLGMTLEASDFRSVRRLVAYSIKLRVFLLPSLQSKEMALSRPFVNAQQKEQIRTD